VAEAPKGPPAETPGAPFRDIAPNALRKTLADHARWCSDPHANGGTRADLSGANLYKQDLRSRLLEGAKFDGANMQEADLRQGKLGGASFADCQAAGADFAEADLSAANLSSGRFERATFTGAKVQGANLEHARFDNSVGLELDGNRIRGATFQGAGEPWTRLKERFSGIRLGLNLILFVVFFLPYVGRALGLVIASEIVALSRSGLVPAPSPEAGSPDLKDVSLLWVLIGGEQDHWALGRWGWCLSLILIAFALARIGATYWTAVLAQREAIPGRAPAKAEYHGLRRLGAFADFLQYASWLAFALNAVQWARLTVPVLK
jgi:hypothetical protein